MTEDRKPGDEHLAVAILLGLVALSFIGYGIVVPLLPFYGVLFEAPPWQVTMLFAMFSIGQFSGELIWGRLSDRLGRKPILLLTIFASAAGYLVLAFAPNIWIAILARGVSGFFSGYISTIQGYMIDVSPRDRLAGRLGMVSAATGTSMILGPALGGFLARPEAGLSGFALPSIAAALLCGVAGFLAFRFLRESRARVSLAQDHPSLAWRDAISDGVASRLLGTTFLAFIAFSVLNSTIGLWGHERFNWSPGHVGFLFAVTGASMVMTQGLVVGWVTRRLGEARAVILGMVACFIPLLALPFIPDDGWVMPCMILFTIGMSVYQPPAMSILSDGTAPNHKGAMLGINAAAGALGRIMGPLLAGVVMSAVSLSAQFHLGSISVFFGIILAYDAARRIRAKPLTPRPAEDLAI